MNGFTASGVPDAVTLTVAALVTLVVLGGLLGERRAFGWTQHLLAGLLTGFLALVALTEVLGPWLLVPLAANPLGRLELWLGVALAAAAAATPWLPRVVAAIPLSIAIGALAAFALGGAVVGTLLPQVAVSIPTAGGTGVDTAVSLATAAVTVLVLLAFVHGTPRGSLVGAATSTGRWVLLAGIGGWVGYLLFSRLVLLVDRIGFLLGDWLGLGR